MLPRHTRGAWTTGAVFGLLLLAGSVRDARAQGCVLIRQNAPIFGADEQIVFTPGEWVINFNYRQSYADDHYSGTQYQYQRKANGNEVQNTQQLYDLGFSYALSPRISFSGSVPVVNASWSIPSPTTPGALGPRREQNASGVGDVIGQARFWMLNPAKHPRGNWSTAIGFKAPTGNAAVEDAYPNLNGTNNAEKTVDQSIQPGDGGWGIVVGLQGYKRWNYTTWYAEGTYLANPRDTNGSASVVDGLGFTVSGLMENSVPDQYMARTGMAFPIKKEVFSMSLGFRIEGVPRYDAIGDSHGFRRPGYETYIEPGFLFTHGSSTYSVYVPRALVRNRLPNPYTGAAGDATFPDFVFLFGYSYKFNATPSSFGRPEPGPMVPPVSPQPIKPGDSGDSGDDSQSS